MLPAASVSADERLHLTDLAFAQMIHDVYGVNRGVYNTIESYLYAKGLTHILDRRRMMLSFLAFLCGREPGAPYVRIKFGNSGLIAKIQEFERVIEVEPKKLKSLTDC